MYVHLFNNSGMHYIPGMYHTLTVFVKYWKKNINKMAADSQTCDCLTSFTEFSYRRRRRRRRGSGFQIEGNPPGDMEVPAA